MHCTPINQLLTNLGSCSHQSSGTAVEIATGRRIQPDRVPFCSAGKYPLMLQCHRFGQLKPFIPDCRKRRDCSDPQDLQAKTVRDHSHLACKTFPRLKSSRQLAGNLLRSSSQMPCMHPSPQCQSLGFAYELLPQLAALQFGISFPHVRRGHRAPLLPQLCSEHPVHDRTVGSAPQLTQDQPQRLLSCMHGLRASRRPKLGGGNFQILLDAASKLKSLLTGIGSFSFTQPADQQIPSRRAPDSQEKATEAPR